MKKMIAQNSQNKSLLVPETDRLCYSDIFDPPEDYSLEFAIGTTYSLDLNALMAVCISIGIDIDLDKVKNDKVYYLNALKKIQDKIIVFADSSQIHIPTNLTNNATFYCFLEKIIVPITLEKNKNTIPSFHPKTWLIAYSKNSEPSQKIFRFAVLSRNLTFDKSWDLTVYIEGTEDKSSTINSDTIVQTERIKGFYNYLFSLSNNQKNWNSRLKTLDQIVFSYNTDEKDGKSNNKESFEVLPIYRHYEKNGFVDIKNDPLFKSQNKSKLLVISPFVSSNILKDIFSGNTDQRILITREDEFVKELEKNKKIFTNEDNSEFDELSGVYVLNDNFIDYQAEDNGYNYQSELDNLGLISNDIHAKLYALVLNNESHLYIGSMNATAAAVDKNVELMIKVSSKHYDYLTKILNDFNISKNENNKGYFKKIELNNLSASLEKKDDLKEIEKEFKEVSRLCFCFNAEIEKDNTGIDYKLRITLQENSQICLKKIDVSIYPLLKKDSKKKLVDNGKLITDITFENLRLTELSEFFQIELEQNSEFFLQDSTNIPHLKRIVIIRLNTNEDILIKRNESIFTEVINNEDSFLRYINMLISDDYESCNLIETEKNMNRANRFNRLSDNNYLYEQLLKLSVNAPKQLNNIKETIDLLQKEKTAQNKDWLTNFNEFFKVFEEFCDKGK